MLPIHFIYTKSRKIELLESFKCKDKPPIPHLKGICTHTVLVKTVFNYFRPYVQGTQNNCKNVGTLRCYSPPTLAYGFPQDKNEL